MPINPTNHQHPSGRYTALATDHYVEIRNWRRSCADDGESHDLRRLAILAACELLEHHDSAEISLDQWTPIRRFVEKTLNLNTILENHA